MTFINVPDKMRRKYFVRGMYKHQPSNYYTGTQTNMNCIFSSSPSSYLFLANVLILINGMLRNWMFNDVIFMSVYMVNAVLGPPFSGFPNLDMC
jgi:hypothetical protein